MSSLSSFLHLYLFTFYLFVNKYVLSVLKFQYPAIFQGWQALCGAALLWLLRRYGKVQLFPQGLAKKDVWYLLTYLPSMSLYTASIYSGSKALAVLPIPVFLVVCSITQIVEFYGDILANQRNKHKAVGRLGSSRTGVMYVSALAILFTAVMAAQTDTMIHNHYSGYWWLTVHIITSGGYQLIVKVKHKHYYTSHEEIFLNYVFSVLLLIPFSVYIGDALEAQQYPYRYFKRFYIGCLASGVLGACYNLSACRNTSRDGSLPIAALTQLAKSISILLSPVLFTHLYNHNHHHHLSSLYHCLWVVCNQVVCFISTTVSPTAVATRAAIADGPSLPAVTHGCSDSSPDVGITASGGSNKEKSSPVPLDDSSPPHTGHALSIL